MNDLHLYRRGVGVMLVNAASHVWVGQRIDNRADAGQMAEGGLDEGEAPGAGALRELEEETGVRPHLVVLVAPHPEPLRYDIPDEIAGKLWGGRWKGQVQDWFLARFTGTDADVDIATEHPEFSQWRWVEPHRLPDLIVPFKRDLYRQIVEGFAVHL